MKRIHLKSRFAVSLAVLLIFTLISVPSFSTPVHAENTQEITPLVLTNGYAETVVKHNGASYKASLSVGFGDNGAYLVASCGADIEVTFNSMTVKYGTESSGIQTGTLPRTKTCSFDSDNKWQCRSDYALTGVTVPTSYLKEMYSAVGNVTFKGDTPVSLSVQYSIR